LLFPLKAGVLSGLRIGVLFGGGLAGLLLGYAAGYLAVLIVGGAVVVRRPEGLRRPTLEHARRLADYANFAWVGSLRSKALNRVDIIVLAFLLSSSLVGIYAVAWNLTQFLIPSAPPSRPPSSRT
jgi:O-antigen/teichoic acid export membrane protein